MMMHDNSCTEGNYLKERESDMTKETDNKQRPVFEKRLNHIRVCVWQNVSDGKPWYNVVFTRRYRDGEDWHHTTTFNGLADLALVREAVDLARDFILAAEAGAGAGANA